MAFKAEVVLFNGNGEVIVKLGDTVKVHTKKGVSIEGQVLDIDVGIIYFGSGIGVDIDDIEFIGLATSNDWEN